MASIQQSNGTYRVIIRHHGKQYFVPIGKVSAEEAEAKAAQVEYRLLGLSQRMIVIPPGMGVAEFVRFDGKPPAPDVATPVARNATLATLRDRYLATHGGARSGLRRPIAWAKIALCLTSHPQTQPTTPRTFRIVTRRIWTSSPGRR
jgi:hypothetical protein